MVIRLAVRHRSDAAIKLMLRELPQAGTGMAMLQTVVAGSPRFLPTIVADKTSSNAVVSAVLAVSSLLLGFLYRGHSGRAPMGRLIRNPRDGTPRA